MRALLLVAHGSRHAAANEEVRSLVARLRRRAEKKYAHVGVAFLEFTEPTLAEGLEACIGLGAERVTVLPYLLAAGRHVNEDIPRQVAARRKAHPEVTIEIAPHVGAAPGLADLLYDSVREL